jgi:phage terminase small subunit
MVSPRDDAKKFYEQGLSLKDVSERLGINYNTIKQWKSRYKWKQTVTKKKNKKVTKKVTVTSKDITPENSVQEHIEDNSELTEKQKLFCLYYIQNFNATQAYLKAYECSYNAAAVEGYKSLINPKIKAEINQLKEIKKQSIMLGPDDIIERYMRIAFSDMTDFAEFGSEQATIEDEDGNEEVIDRDYFRFRDSKSVDGGLISEIKKSRQGMSIKLEDRQKALSWLAKFFEMDPEHKHRKEFDSKKLHLEHERFDHQKQLDSKKDW